MKCKTQTLIVILTWSWHVRVLGSAHRLTEMNILPKFNENPSKGLEV